MRFATICFAILIVGVGAGFGQDLPPLPGSPSSRPGDIPQAPIGHRQPTPSDLPPDVRKQEEPNAPQSQPQPQSQAPPLTKSRAQPSTKSQSQSRQVSVKGRGGGGSPPLLQVGPSCEAAGRGAVVLGRNKESCLADETAALNTLEQNWSKYAASDKTLCIGMESTGGPASYVELLSCLEVNRDARDIQSLDPLEGDLDTSASTTTGSASVDNPRHRRRR